MAYNNKLLGLSVISYDDFIEVVKKIECQFTDEIAKKFDGKTIFVTLPQLYNATSFVNTTVSDLLEVYGDDVFEINMLSTYINSISNMSVMKIAKASKKDFKNELRFLPQKTLKVTLSTICTDGVHTDIYPVLQDEKYLLNECKKSFDSGRDNFEEVARNSINILYYDKRVSKTKINDFLIGKAMDDVRNGISEYISLVADVCESWGITYIYKNILFIFPVNKESYKTVFRDREKIDGRKRQLPVIVKGHARKNSKNVDSHLRIGSDYVTIGGREFSFFIGSEDIQLIFPNTKNSIKRAKKLLESKQLNYESQ